MADEMKHEDEIIELTEVVETEADLLEEGKDEILDFPHAEPETLPPVTAVSEEEVMAALEAVIEKKFSQKIEAMLTDVMEKVISKEVAEIRENLQKDLDQIIES